MKTIIIAAHKKSAFPNDALYLPVHVGAAGKETIPHTTRDDSGVHISAKNPGYSELTGLYWAWKNLPEADVLGLVHYRRYFTAQSAVTRRKKAPLSAVLSTAECSILMAKYDLLVPRKRIYAIETLYSHYAHTLDAYQLDCARELVAERYPAYAPYLELIYNRRWGYMFNMMIARRPLYDEYCRFLFDVLFALEDRLEQEGYLKGLSAFEARLFGRVSEILFNVWVEKKRSEGTRFKEVAVLHTQPEPWIAKGRAFLSAKFRNKRYGDSF